MSDADERPRPQYGEYATPEEQRARIQQPAAGEALSSGISPDAPSVIHPAAPIATTPVGAAPAVPMARAPRTWDRMLTILMLSLGAVNVLFSVVSYLNLSDSLAAAFTYAGITGEFTNFDSARTWGVISAVVLVVGFAATVFFAVRRLRRGRLTWWVPIVGAVITFAAVLVCFSVPLATDPAFIDFVQSSAR